MSSSRPSGLPALCLSFAIAWLASVTPAQANQAVVVRHGDTSRPVVALTFDDGWSAQNTARIVEILDEHGATGTFLPYANAVREAPELWRSIARRFPIANHTVSHRRLPKLTSAQIYAEIDGARRLIEGVVGVPMVRALRPPYGLYDDRVLAEAARAGFNTLAMWSVDGRDARRVSDGTVFRHAIRGTNGAIITLHAGPARTVRVLPSIIAWYRARGFGFVTLPEMLGLRWDPAERVPLAPSGPPPSTVEGIRDARERRGASVVLRSFGVYVY